jgi:hypothetical protein
MLISITIIKRMKKSHGLNNTLLFVDHMLGEMRGRRGSISNTLMLICGGNCASYFIVIQKRKFDHNIP